MSIEEIRDRWKEETEMELIRKERDVKVNVGG